MNNGRILVTGADGFFGRNFVATLPNTDDAYLHCGLRESVEPYQSNGYSNVSYGDLSGNATDWGLPDVDIETLVHFAGLPCGNEHDLMRANVTVTENVISWAMLHGVSRIVFASTAAVYGDTCNDPATEMHSLDPQTPYALSKVKAEEILTEFSESDRTVVSLRIPHAYGSGKPVGILASIVDHAMSDGVIRLDGDGDEKRDFVYIDDVIDAFTAGCRASLVAGFHAYNIGYGKSLSLRDACRIVSKVAQHELNVELSGNPAGKPHCIQLDVSEANVALGWSPSVDLTAGVRKMLNRQPDVVY